MIMALQRSDMNFNCPMCSYNSYGVKDILSHIRAYHSNEPNFCVTCGLDGCPTTSKSFSGLYSHIYRQHSEYIDKRGRYNNAVDNDVVESTLNRGGNTQDVVDSASRLFDESPTDPHCQGIKKLSNYDLKC